MDTVTESLKNNQIQVEIHQELIDRFLAPFFAGLNDEAKTAVKNELTWQTLDGGDYLFRAGETGDCMYVLFSGRLQVVVAKEHDEEFVQNHIVIGETVGEMALFTQQPRTASIRASRDSVLARLSRSSFEKLALLYPALALNTGAGIIDRLAQSLYETRDVVSHCVNLVLFFAHATLPTSEIISNLKRALGKLGNAIFLDEEHVDHLMRRPGVSQCKPGEAHYSELSSWLNRLEDGYRFVVYLVEYKEHFGHDEWSKRCLRQADKTFVFADAAESEQALPKVLSPGAVKGSRELVLVHESDKKHVTNAARFLKRREFRRHHHLHLDNGEDFNRLARFTNDSAVGIVLAGGGARGLSQIGILRALREASITIDSVGGTSMGAIVGSGVACGFDDNQIEAGVKDIFLTSRSLKEYGLPFVSIVKGTRLDATSERHLGNRQIEDLPVPFFCIASDLINKSAVVLKTGLLWKALRASGSLPGFLPPVVLGESVLVDGGVINNLPVDVMQQEGAGKVIAIDVNVNRELGVKELGDFGTWQRLGNLVSNKNKGDIPGIVTIMNKTTLLGSEQHARKTRAMADVYLNPPVQELKLLDFSAFDKAVAIGYEYANKELEKGTFDVLS